MTFNSWPAITVAVSTRNRGALIIETLEALLGVDYPNFQVLVVDQSTNDATCHAVESVARGDRRVRYEPSKTVGLPAGRNVGLELSTGEIVVYTDDDCIVTPEWLRAYAEAFRPPEVAAVYGRLLPYEYRERTGRDVGLKDSLEATSYDRKTPPWHIGHGGNMAFRRQSLLKVGGFDPLLGAGAPLCSNEDGDISYRLLAAGMKVLYSPDALAYHKHWKDWTAQKKMERAYGIGAGAQFAKYVRLGDLYGLRLLAIWVWQLGVRRVGSGLLKWRSVKTMYLGYCQLVYPWLGIWKARRYEIDRRHVVYRDV